MKTINWKARCLAAEKCVELLRIEKETEENFIDLRPFKEKIVEKEVLPKFVLPMMAGIAFCAAGLGLAALVALRQLETPIVKPYAVYLVKNNPETEARLSECKSVRERAWVALKFHHNQKAMSILDEEVK